MLFRPHRTCLALPGTTYRAYDCLKILLSCFRARTSVQKAPFAFRYLLFEGSLVGLYHNSGPLPWDDDVDVVMMEEDALKLIEMVESKKAITFLGYDQAVEKELSLAIIFFFYSVV